jgi:hypothetical protein
MRHCHFFMLVLFLSTTSLPAQTGNHKTWDVIDLD